MQVEVKAWAYDILNAIQEIEVFVGVQPDCESYKSDLKTRRAVERSLEIIDEAMSPLIKKMPEADFPDARKIVAVRNRIIHGYDQISDDIIWVIVTTHLPKLKDEMRSFLKD